MNSQSLCVAIPFVKVDPSQNPNLKVRPGEDPAHAYYRAMVVAFASVRRFNPEVSLWLITNAAVEEPFRGQLERLRVEFKIRPFLHVPPTEFTATFAASLYLLDALGVLTHDKNLLIDPDVLCVRSLDALIAHTKDAAGILPIDYEADLAVNGLSRRQAGELHGMLGEPQELPIHCGGEAIILPLAIIPAIEERCERAWQLALQRHAEGKPKFCTEEHILSFAARGVRTSVIGQFASRIWTAHRLRSVSGKENDLTLWHLPAEKDRGFARLYMCALDAGSWFWTSGNTQFADRCGRAMGLHHRPLPRVAMDWLGQAIHLVRKKILL